MKKHRKQVNTPKAEPRAVTPPAAESEADFAIQLEAMFRSELGEAADERASQRQTAQEQAAVEEVQQPTAAEPEQLPETEALRLAISELLRQTGADQPKPEPAASESDSHAEAAEPMLPRRGAGSGSAGAGKAPENELRLALDTMLGDTLITTGAAPMARLETAAPLEAPDGEVSGRSIEKETPQRPAASVPEQAEPSAPPKQAAEPAAPEKTTASEPESVRELRSGPEERTLSRREQRERKRAAKRAAKKERQKPEPHVEPEIADQPEPAPALTLRVEGEALPAKEALAEASPSDSALWSDAELFAAIDDLLAHDAFAPREPAKKPQQLEARFIPYEPEPELEAEEDIAIFDEPAPSKQRIPEPEPEPEPEVREPTIRMNLSTETPVITRPLPSLEELFGPKDESEPVEPEPPAVSEMTWDALPSLEELFGKTDPEPVYALPPEPPSPEPEEPHETAEAEQTRLPLESERSRRREARRKKRGWLSELLHPHPEPEFYFESETEQEPEPVEPEEGPLPDQIPLEGFASETLPPREWGLPNQLPLDDGFSAALPQRERSADQIPDWLRHRRDSGETAPDAEIPEWLKSLSASDEVILPAKPRQESAPAPAAQTAAASADQPAAKPKQAAPTVQAAPVSRDDEDEDGFDLIPQVRMQNDPTAPRTGVFHLEDLLAAAVPMEETARPSKPETAAPVQRKHKNRTRSTEPHRPRPEPSAPTKQAAPAAVVPEVSVEAKKPEAPKQTAVPKAPDADQPSVPKVPAVAEKPEAPKQAVVPKAPEADQPSAPQVPAAAEKPAAKPPAATEKPVRNRPERPAGPDPNSVFDPLQPPRRPANEPVVSASVRSRRAAQTEEPRPEPSRPARRDAAARPKPEPRRPDADPDRPILHPEEAYRKYSRNLSSVGSCLVLTGLFSLLSLFLTLYLLLGWKFLPEIFSGGTSVYVLLLLLAAMVLTNLRLYADAVRSLFRKLHSPDLLLVVATIFTALDTLQAAQTVRPPFVIVIGLLLLLSLWGKYDHNMALLATVRLLREKDGTVGVAEVQDIAGGGRGLTRTSPDIPQFMQKLESPDRCSRAVSIYVPVALLAGFVVTLLVCFGMKGNLFWTGSLLFIGACPVASLLAFPRLFRLLAFRLSENGAALCGWHGAEVFGGDHAILIGDEDIFPQGALSLNGFKVYNGNPDRIIAYAAAASRRSGSALAPLFEDLLRIHVCRRYTVDSFRFYDSGGIGATIIGDVVLMGSLEFMRHMGVHMDKGAKVRQAVYLSINGELAAVFAVKYAPPENLRLGLAAIAGNRRFRGILATRTFLGTPAFLKAKFGIPTGSFAYPPIRDRLRLSETEMKAGSDQGAVLTSSSFSSFAQAAAGGRMLRSATTLSTVLSIAGGVVGLLLMTVLAILPAYEAATALNILIYTAAWLVPTILLTAWAKHF